MRRVFLRSTSPVCKKTCHQISPVRLFSTFHGSGMIPKCRLRVHNKNAPGGKCIFYWMTANRRTEFNHALEHAIYMATERDLPLVVVEPIFLNQKHACDRFHTFAAQGMADNEKAFSPTPITYVPFVERKSKEGLALLNRCMEYGDILVIDDCPVHYPRRVMEKAISIESCSTHSVDSHGFSAQREYEEVFDVTQFFRKHLQRTVRGNLAQFPHPEPLTLSRELRKVETADFEKIFGEIPAVGSDLVSKITSKNTRKEALQTLDIDHSVWPVEHAKGGPIEANGRWDIFFTGRLNNYHNDRPLIETNGISALSPYLHFGHLSIHRVLSDIFATHNFSVSQIQPPHDGRRRGWWQLPAGIEVFLDQAITWREMGMKHCTDYPNHTEYASVPNWARATLKQHQNDQRRWCYDLDQFESAMTHDRLWNAAQVQLMTDGYIHNSLRMLWGKKILEWSRDGETAMEIMIHLNDKYALDGRDPNSYSGIGWIMGKFDKPFNERPIIGTIRWMNSDSSYRKYPTDKFLATYNKVGETLMDWLATDAEPGKKPEPVKFNPDPPKKNSKARRVQNGSYSSENINRKRGPQKIDSKTQKTIDLKKQLSSFNNNFSS